MDAAAGPAKLASGAPAHAPPRLVLAFLGHVLTHGLTLPSGAEMGTPAAGDASAKGASLGASSASAGWNGTQTANRPAMVAGLLRGPAAAKARHQVGLLQAAPLPPRQPWAPVGGVGGSLQPHVPSARFRPVLNPSTVSLASKRTSDGANHPARLELRRLSEEEPGLNIHEIARLLKLSRSATRYHLRCLIREGQVVTHRQGHHLLHFAASMRPTQRQAVAFLRIGSVRSIIEAAIQNPTLQPAALAAKLGISARSVRRSLKMLGRAGLVREDEGAKGKRGRCLALHPDLRIAWVLWCKNAERAQTIAPLAQAPAWVVAIEIVLSQVVTNWFT